MPSKKRPSNYQLTASPYRKKFLTTRFEKILPDIWIDKPDDIFFEGKGRFVAKNRDFGPVTDLAKVYKDMYTGIKGRYPLCWMDPETNKRINSKDPLDLRLIYFLIQRTFQ